MKTSFQVPWKSYVALIRRIGPAFRAVEEFWSGDWYLDPSGARWIKIGRERVVDADETENNYLAARRVQRFGAEGIWNDFCAVASEDIRIVA